MVARNRTSKSLVVGGGAFMLIIGVIILARTWMGDSATVESIAVEGNTGAAVSEATADRPEETVQALAGSVESIRSRIGELDDWASGGLDAIRKEISGLREGMGSLQEDQRETIKRESRQAQAFSEQLFAETQARLAEVEARLGADYPVQEPVPVTRGVIGQDGLIWHAAPEPGAAAEEPAWRAVTEQWSLGNIPAFREAGLAPAEDEPPPPVAVYTIPAEATLVRARGLTALIGRVPIDGQVTDPMPFKVLIGRENLLANGQRLPEVERAIFSGQAFGDATLHCVSGRLEQVTFIFSDGGVSTYPADGGGSEPLGYISDRRGYPCIPGQYVSNLGENIGRLSASSFAAGLAQAYSEQQVTVSREGGQTTRSVTGNVGEYALGRGVADGISQWSRIIAERAAQAFDVVVVAPGHELTVHIHQSIPVDWQPEGRRVRHVAALGEYGYHTGGLD